MLLRNFLVKKIDDQASGSEEIASVPTVNINDKGKTFEVSLAAPGMDKKDIKLEVKDNCLVVSSEKQYEKEENDGNWMRREYGYASFQRMFQLPENADPEHVDASMKNGVLKIKVGKIKGKEENKKAIEIK